jgi:hypothetical protein
MLVFVVAAMAAFARDPSARTTATACGPADVNFDVQDDASQPSLQPVAGKAVVYVIQDDGAGNCVGPFWGCFTTKIGLDGAWTGATHHDSYLQFNVDPGERHLCVTLQTRLKAVSQLAGLAHFEAESGGVYYFRARAFGHGAASQVFLDLDPIDSDQGKFLVGEFSLSISRPKK